MTEPQIDPVVALKETWRSRSLSRRRWQHAATLRRCADELEAALAASQAEIAQVVEEMQRAAANAHSLPGQSVVLASDVVRWADRLSPYGTRQTKGDPNG